MKLQDFDFVLPKQLIALRPVNPRSSARMLVSRREAVTDHRVAELPSLLSARDRLVVNNTKVIPAALCGTRERQPGVRISLNLVEDLGAGEWRALVRPLRKLRDGDRIRFSRGFEATVMWRRDGAACLHFQYEDKTFGELLRAHGQAPLPPYIASKRPPDERDKQDYQSRFAQHNGAVAAPTASLHFDDKLVAELERNRIGITPITLHVGEGTFLPLKSGEVNGHELHAERGQITRAAVEELKEAKASGGRVIAVGTTALRVLETAADPDGTLRPWEGQTNLYIRPGYKFRFVDGLLTNFHLPKSSLFVLVAAVVGLDRAHRIYAHAIASRYRFYSYGDCTLLFM